MKLKRLWINGYKNLNELELDFTDKNGILVLIGNNGSGKSNIIEAISEIFTALFKMGTPDRKPKFQYEIEYILNNNKYYHISLLESINGDKIYNFHVDLHPLSVQEFKRNPYIHLPSNLVAIYSGEETRLWDKYYKYLYADFMKEVKNEFQGLPTPKLVYINKYFWDIALLSLLYSNIPSNQEFCKKILKVDNLEDISIELKFNTNNLNNFQDNSIITFVNQLNISYQSITPFTIKDLKTSQFIASERELFLKLMASVMDKMSKYKLIKEISINFKDNLTADILSEGEKKQILIRTSLDIVADLDSLILMDEPDSNIHVANKSKIKNILTEYENRETILTTHSPTLMNIFENNLVYLEEGKVKGKEKAKILKDISGNTMSIVEQQIALNSPNDILLVEGKLDILFIKEAINRMDEEEEYTILNNLNYIPTGGASGLRLFIDKFVAKDNQNIIAILDYDKAGKSEVNEILTPEYKDSLSSNGYVKINELKNTYLLYLPKPTTVTNQQYEIEDYFPLEKLNEISKKQIDTFKVLKDFKLDKKFVKNELSKECEKETYNKSDFNEFKILFNKILEIKNL